jgi:holo-[acyl-carrier protein] synthase
MERAGAVGLPERVASVEEILWHRDDYGMITLPDEVDGHRVRVGCDVVAIEDVQDSLAAFGDRYLRKVFTASEINDCRGSNRVQRLAARFAAKEAVIKAFAEPDMPFPWREIEVTRDGPLPLLRLSGTLAEQAQHQGWASSSLSLSHADCHAMAVVLVVCGGNAGVGAR